MNNPNKLKENIVLFKQNPLSDKALQELIEAIENPENPYADIHKKLGMGALAFAMLLSNLCAQESLNRGYEAKQG